MVMTRREALIATAVASAGFTPKKSSGLDRALERLHQTDPEFAAGGTSGLSNHGPMACEALVALGREDRCEAFLETYLPRLSPFQAAAPLTAKRSDYGDPSKIAAWIATFERRLRSQTPHQVLAQALPQLLPGMSAAAFHGLLRAAHAARALTRGVTRPRLRELAFGLGYWAGRYLELPGTPGANRQRGRGVQRGLIELELVPTTLRRKEGLIFERVVAVADLPSFKDQIESLDLEDAPFDEALSTLCDAAARLYLASPSSRFINIHMLTGSSALRLLKDHLDQEQRLRAVGFAFQCVAALHATHGLDARWHDRVVPRLRSSPEALARAAAQSSDDHTIKFVEACLREYAISGAPSLLAAAAHRVGQ